MWYTLQSGIVYGPYGGVGFIQQHDLRHVKDTCLELFRWFRNLWSKEP